MPAMAGELQYKHMRLSMIKKTWDSSLIKLYVRIVEHLAQITAANNGDLNFYKK